jgi:chromosomal replication initiation ATPase DnaA
MKLKKQLNLSNTDMAEIFGFKNVESYNNSPRREKYEAALIKLYRIFKENEYPGLYAIFNAIEKVTGITEEQIKGRSRTDRIAFARQLLHYFYSQTEGILYLREVGKATNNDHTTVIHSKKIVESEIKYKGWRKDWYEKIDFILKNN